MSTADLISVLVPVRERPEPLDALYEECARPLREAGLPFEFVFICQPWFESLLDPLMRLAGRGEPIRLVRPAHGIGEATMLKIAADRARGNILLTLPAYRRVDVDVLIELIARLDRADLALAVRWPRRDSWVNRLQNRWFHRIVRWLTGSSFRDLASGVRAMHRRVIEETPLYGDFFRFLPLLAEREGFTVVEVEARQHPGDDEPRVYSPGVYLRRALDLLGLFFLLRFTDKPLRFFGLLGSASALAGMAVLALVSIQRIQGNPLADRPVLLLGVLLLVLGVQAVALGLIGEMIVYHHAHGRRRYRLAERVTEDAEDSEGPGDDAPGGPASASPSAPGGGRPMGTAGPRRAVWLRLAIGLGLLAVLLARVDLSERTIRVGPEVLTGIAVTWILLLLAQAVSALRWRKILGEADAGWGYLFRLYLVGNFFSLFLPTSVGGDAVRAVAASRSLPARVPAVTSVIVDRLVGVAALAAYLGLGLVVAPAVVLGAAGGAEWRVPSASILVAATAAIAVAAAATVVIARRSALWGRLAPAFELIRRLRESPGTLAAVGGLSLVVQGLYIVAWALLAAALGLGLPAALFVAAVPVVSLLAMLPVSLSGIGVREGAWLLILAPFGVPAADAIAFSLVFFVAFALVGAVGGVAYALLGTSPRDLPAETRLI